jgi:L-threonylcarbamoyladenylate synthase
MTNTQLITECSANAIQKAAELLKAGHLVAFPTETVYGLGADATKEDAVRRIYDVKGRPTNHPLIVHVSSMNALDVWAKDIPGYAVDLARTFWPGPMTLILNRTEFTQDFITGGQNSVGIRIPGDPIALDLLSRFESLGGLGIAAPSANRFGKVSPTSASDVEEELGKYLAKGDLILDGGRSTIGIESTIIDCRNKVASILRPGAVTEVMINTIVRVKKKSHKKENVRVSGNLENHYAPKAKVILNRIPEPGQAFIAMSEIETPIGVIRIASPSTVEEFVHDLYSALRKVDDLSYKEVVITTPHESGLGIAANDRLLKAAFKPNF